MYNRTPSSYVSKIESKLSDGIWGNHRCWIALRSFCPSFASQSQIASYLCKGFAFATSRACKHEPGSVASGKMGLFSNTSCRLSLPYTLRKIKVLGSAVTAMVAILARKTEKRWGKILPFISFYSWRPKRGKMKTQCCKHNSQHLLRAPNPGT